MSYYRRFRDAVLCAALLVVPFFVLNTNLKDPANATEIDKFLLKLSAPFQYAATEAARTVSGVLEDYVYLVDVREDNEALRLDNARLADEVRLLRLQATENRRLRELLQLRDQIGGDTIAAQVISKDLSPVFRVVRVVIDRGDRDRVHANMPVVSTHGLVGQIGNTTGRYADVRLTVDRQSAVDVIVPRTGARGMLRGTGDNDRYACHIQYLQRTDEVQEGDEVYTSGLGHRFPASILVGRVTKVVRQDFNLYQEVEVTPSVDFSTLEEVLVLTTQSREQEATEGRFGEADAEGATP